VLTIHVPIGPERYDEETRKFIPPKTFQLDLEHSLVTVSKWECFFEKPFLGPQEKTPEETLHYIKLMTITPDVHPRVFEMLTEENAQAINNYINAKMTATWFRGGDKPSQEIITNELIYYWMFSFGIDKECEEWHLNRLLTLIRVFNLKNSPEKKMTRAELAKHNRELNEARQKQFNTTG
jgi:hypothetical protein